MNVAQYALAVKLMVKSINEMKHGKKMIVQDGVHYCQKHMCQVECDNPRKIPGQCCPICDEPIVIVNPAICPSLEHCPLRCENGLIRDSNGCFQCKCAPVQNVISNSCRELSDINCDKICAHGYLRDAKNCAICKCAKCPPLHQCYKHCLYGFESNNNGCPVCKCRGLLFYYFFCKKYLIN
ncbi:unnamed protein product [Onchocerca flexuosa]|uniref:Antistasin-like domain-containing protein n=1 Tax=Onchocerca flexuosa TaxID=387005 RepID=A0A183I700_9BILA|nr:unnamed protein product [Onchocerca flexuosa]